MPRTHPKYPIERVTCPWCGRKINRYICGSFLKHVRELNGDGECCAGSWASPQKAAAKESQDMDQ